MVPTSSANRTRLVRAAEVLAPLLQDIVFVGGQVTELLITDPAAVRVRPTYDVDVVVPTTSKAQYDALSTKLRQLGLRNDTSRHAPLCRWLSADNVTIDVMPIGDAVLGFSNRWYRDVMDSAIGRTIGSGVEIRIAAPPAFLATKLEAFRDRGRHDLLGSHDLEDIIMLASGRPSLAEEVKMARPALGAFVAEQCQLLLDQELFAYAIQGAIPDAAALPGIIEQVLERFRTLAAPRPVD